MIKSIQQFGEKGIEKIEKATDNFYEDPGKMAEFVYAIRDTVIDLGLAIIGETFGEMDNFLRQNRNKRQDWTIVRRDEAHIMTSLGNVSYHKTLFKNKIDGRHEYLVDQLMGITPHEKMTEDALASLLQETVESTYRKGGEAVSISDSVSKQTVKNKIHSLRFMPEKKNPEKRDVEYLYIDADEDHVSLQFEEKKGDLQTGEVKKNNTVLSKLVYVYEGIRNEHPSGGRKVLVNPRYFSGVYEGEKGNEALWKEVWGYIQANYDVEKIQKVFITGDGASWIKSGVNVIKKSKFIADRFHTTKYINQICTPTGEAAKELKALLYRGINGKRWDLVEAAIDTAEAEIPGEVPKTFYDAKTFLTNNKKYILDGVSYREKLHGCSAEGHVSHVLSSRLSSRPLGWSRKGVDQMSKLRAFRANGGDYLQLARYQKREEKPNKAERKPNMRELRASFVHKIPYSQRYVEQMTANVASRQIKKMLYFSTGITGL